MHNKPKPLNIPGLSNAYDVDGTLWRSAQPADTAFPLLYAAGCRFVIDLNNTGAEAERQKALAEAAGLEWYGFGWDGVEPPSLAQQQAVADYFLAAFARLGAPGIVHCKHGSDRTGAACADIRMRRDKLSFGDAMCEALFGFGWGGMHEGWLGFAVHEYDEWLANNE